jgi:hypothetical protein
MRALNKRLTYANVMSSIAVFLILGGAAFAAGKVGNKSVGPNQLKANAVTTKKIKKNAVTKAKIANDAISFGKLSAGTNLVATATGGPIAANVIGPTAIPLSGPVAFTPQAGVLNVLHVEARGSLARSGKTECGITVQPLVNGGLLEVSSGFLFLGTDEEPTTTPDPFRPVLLDSESAPVGITQPGVKQEVTLRLLGDAKNCTASSTVTVGVAVTQQK